MSKLSILLICEQPLPSRKRAGRPNYSVKYLSELSCDLTVICPKSEHPKDSLANYEYIDLEFKQFDVIPRLKLMREMKKKIKKVVKKQKFDIIRTINIIPTYVAISAKDELNIPIYAELTDFISDLYVQFDLLFKKIAIPFLKRIEKKIAKRVDYANVETEVGRKFWNDYGLDKEKIVIIPNGVDTEHFNPNKANSKAIKDTLTLDNEVIFYHGDMGPYDGIHLLIKAMKSLKENASLLIVGDGKEDYMSYLKSLIDKYELNKQVKLTGWIEYEELPHYISTANLCAFPLIAKSRQNLSVFHSKLKEYLSMCKPFIVTKTEGIYRSLGNIPIYFRNPSNINLLAEDLRNALNEVKEKDYSFMREIAKKLDWKNIIYQDLKVMEAIVEGKAKDLREFDLKLNVEDIKINR
ncbi:MAG: glycosyltransferase [Thermoprotei archaeon]